MTINNSANAPGAYVASNRNRLKVYTIASGTSAPQQSVFLKGGQEFEIELFNPLQETVAAKIYLNGKAISESMIVLRPGERTYLERFLDEKRKLKFDTYSVDGSSEAQKAIEKNGLVRVEFFKEQPVAKPWYPWSTTTNITGINNPGTFTGGNTAGGYVPLSGTIHDSNAFYCSSVQFDASSLSLDSMNYSDTLSRGIVGSSANSAKRKKSVAPEEKSVETGRIEAGASSAQDFSTYSGNFQAYYFAAAEYHILPESHKPVEVNKIRNYCSNCGTRARKSSWKFCPNCSAKLD